MVIHIHLLFSAKQFAEITKDGVEKIANIVSNGKIVLSATIVGSIGRNPMISFSNKEEVEQCIKSLGFKK
ncbi:MAG: hypothetical protein A3E84_05095 [Gammaproteobacteria bacterium RIFCSPHIGHO2_12_FULL_42_13]|nr:MAG: hypothetical protein A3E84_05095 [Gammaproteobacteria bacterium RIFCSPHIGHO2_12_FULL_42_13]